MVATLTIISRNVNSPMVHETLQKDWYAIF